MFPVIEIGPLSLPTSSFLLIIGFFIGSYLLEKRAHLFLLDSAIIDRAVWIGTLSALLGARLSYIAGSPAAFKGNLISIISLNPSLLDPIGGLLIGIAALFVFISTSKIETWIFLDSMTLFIGSLFLAFFLSRFASGKDYGLITDLPWGIYLWGAIRHPVQLYLAFFALVNLILMLYSAPLKNLPSGSSFLLFSMITSGYFLLLTYFQEPISELIFGFRPIQIISWLILFVTILLFNIRMERSPIEEENEVKK